MEEYSEILVHEIYQFTTLLPLQTELNSFNASKNRKN